ncbi:MAG: sulfotransferase domain-containing protein [Ilumatobacter sp.]
MTSTASLRLKLVVTPPRSASTWSYDMLWADPDLRVGTSKEIRFLSTPEHRSVDWYVKQFRKSPPDGPLVDVCHDYFEHPEAPSRALTVTNEVAAVIVLRDPVTRTRSDFLNRQRNGRYRTDISYLEALRTDETLLGCSRYAADARRWRDTLGAHRCRFQPFELMKADPHEGLLQMYEHLGLAPPEQIPMTATAASNAAQRHRNVRVARVGRAVGANLQRVGLHRVTHAVKRNRVVQRALYADAATSQRTAVADDEAADDYVRTALTDDVDELCDVSQFDFRSWWTAFSGDTSSSSS